MTKILSTLVLVCLIRFVSFADIGCDAYKQQVVNDCNSTIANVRLVSQDVLSIINSIDLLKQDTNLSPYYGSLDGISASANAIYGYCVSAISSIESIRDTALSLQCSSNTVGSCNCREVLDNIYSELQSLNIEVTDINSQFHDLQTVLVDYYEEVKYFLEQMNQTDTDYYNFVTNTLKFRQATTYPSSNFLNTNIMYKNGNNLILSSIPMIQYQLFSSSTAMKNNTVLQSLDYGFGLSLMNLSSLNNFAYSNMFAQSSIYGSINNVYGTLTNVVQSIDMLSHNFNVDSPLSLYSNGDGDYHSFLTNYYIRVATGQNSASEPHTNWFSRIEMLLGSLVFQPSGSNFVNDADLDSQVNQIQSSLESSLEDLQSAVDLPDGFEDAIRGTGKSFLDVLGGFHDAISGNSLPSTFTLVDISLSNSRSTDNLNRLTLSTPVSGSFLSFLQVCHSVTTICFTMLFCYWSISFIIFFCSKISKLISVCFHVFASLIGSS